MPLFLLLLALLVPRIVIGSLWLFTHWFSGLFDDPVIPVLGFAFLPYTLLWYSVVANLFSGTWGFWQMAILTVAMLLDCVSLATAGGRGRSEEW